MKVDGMMLYLAYGTNIPTIEMADRAKDATCYGWGVISNYRMAFGSGGFATLLPAKGMSTPVAIYSCSQNDFSRLDVYEGCPHFYHKESMTYIPKAVRYCFKPDSFIGIVYVMNPGNKIMLPNARALKTAADGYRELGMPLKELEAAAKWSAVHKGELIEEGKDYGGEY